MISALVLLCFALSAATFGSRRLSEAQWTGRAPRLGILAWQGLSLSVLGSLALACLAVAMALPAILQDGARWTDLCAASLWHVNDSPGRLTATALGVALTAMCAARIAFCVLAVDRRQRRDHQYLVHIIDIVALKDRSSSGSPAVLAHDVPYAFCVPGAQPRVVLTTALLEKLTKGQVRAVLAHELAHIRQKHHRILQLPRTLLRAFGGVAPFLDTAHEQTARLVELLADDEARDQAGDTALRTALRLLSAMPSRAGALAASARDVQERTRRLDDAPPAMSPTKAWAIGLAILMLTLVPLVVAAAPALMVGWHDLCHFA